MTTTGFLGTRADAFVDLAIVFFIVAPFLMAYALRLAAQRRHREHRNLQAGLLLAGIVAVVMLWRSASGSETPRRPMLVNGRRKLTNS